MDIAVLLLLVSALAATTEFPLEDPRLPHPSSTYNFLALADWGDDGLGQSAAAAGLGRVAETINATSVFVLGDNFYTHGIDDTSDGRDGVKRFEKTFERVYNAASLLTIPFFVVAGNHDHLGNVTAQMAYSNNAQNRNFRWHFPYYWHNVTTRFIDAASHREVEVEVLLYDSVVMQGNFLADRGNSSDGDDAKHHLLSELTGPANATLAKLQLEWLSSRLQTSTADYLWVGGHYPIWAIGQDAPTGVRQQLRSLLNEHEAHYFNGHEHDFEHIVEANTTVNYISTGAGKECCYKDSNVNTVPIDSIRFAVSGVGGQHWYGKNVTISKTLVASGFTSYRIDSEKMYVVYHASDGTVLYVTPPIAPRSKRKQPPPAKPLPMCTPTLCPYSQRVGEVYINKI